MVEWHIDKYLLVLKYSLMSCIVCVNTSNCWKSELLIVVGLYYKCVCKAKFSENWAIIIKQLSMLNVLLWCASQRGNKKWVVAAYIFRGSYNPLAFTHPFSQ